MDAAYFGDSFAGLIPDNAGLKGKNAEQQFVTLARSWDYSRMDFTLEVSVNRKAVYLNCLFWIDRDFIHYGIDQNLKSAVLKGGIEAWRHNSIEPSLPVAFTRTVPQV